MMILSLFLSPFFFFVIGKHRLTIKSGTHDNFHMFIMDLLPPWILLYVFFDLESTLHEEEMKLFGAADD